MCPGSSSASSSSGRDPADIGASARRAAGAFVLILLLLVPACGYRLQGAAGSPLADAGTRVDLRPFINQSLVPDAGAVLASRLREEIRRNGFRGTFQRSMADYAVEGTIREIREEVVSHGEDEFALEHRLNLVIDIRVVEVTRGRLLWKEEGLSESASYFAGPDFQYTESNRRTAFEEACRRMAVRIGQTLLVIL